jgi:hypothetical protein
MTSLLRPRESMLTGATGLSEIMLRGLHSGHFSVAARRSEFLPQMASAKVVAQSYGFRFGQLWRLIKPRFLLGSAPGLRILRGACA